MSSDKEAILNLVQDISQDFNKVVSDEDIDWFITKTELSTMRDKGIDVATFLRSYLKTVRLTVDPETIETYGDQAFARAKFSYKSLKTFADKLNARMKSVDDATAERIRKEGTGSEYILQIMHEILDGLPQADSGDDQVRLNFKKSGDTFVPDNMHQALVTIFDRE